MFIRNHSLMHFHCHAGLEAEYLTELAGERSVVLLCLFCFDILTYIVRCLQLLTLGHKARDRHWTAIVPQMVNMAILWVVIWSINRRSRKSHGKPWAAAQVCVQTCCTTPAMSHECCNACWVRQSLQVALILGHVSSS